MDMIPFGFDPFSAEGSLFQFKAAFPKVDIKETNKDIIVVADVPGVDPQKVNVEVSETSLKLSGEVSREKESKGKNFYRKERSTHSFERVIPLPCPVKNEDVTALAKNGTLTITLPKKHAQEPKMKKIPVEEA